MQEINFSAVVVLFLLASNSQGKPQTMNSDSSNQESSSSAPLPNGFNPLEELLTLFHEYQPERACFGRYYCDLATSPNRSEADELLLEQFKPMHVENRVNLTQQQSDLYDYYHAAINVGIAGPEACKIYDCPDSREAIKLITEEIAEKLAQSADKSEQEEYKD